jgi:hypothetical protein
MRDLQITSTRSSLRDGVLLEDSGIMLPWRTPWSMLCSIANPTVWEGETGLDATLQWSDRDCLGGIRCTLWCRKAVFDFNHFFQEVDLDLPLVSAHSHAEAVGYFHQAVEMLKRTLGTPDVYEAPAELQTAGIAEWQVSSVVVCHSLTWPWDGWRNRTSISFVPRSIGNRFRQVGQRVLRSLMH